MNRSNIRMSVKRILKKTVALVGVALCASSGFALQQDNDGFYMIADSSDWSDFSTLVKTMPTANVKMVSDIDLEGVERSPIGTFNGVFDGAGHTISNLVVNLPTTDDVGLFSILKNATIKNLSVCGGRIEARCRAGGLAGRFSGGVVVEDCTTDLEVVAQGYDAGGIVAWMEGSAANRLTRCRALGPVTAYAAEDRAGGLVAMNDGSFTIDSCYASGAVTGYGTTGHVGGLLGRRYGGTVTVTNSYSVSRLQGNYITQGGSADDDIVGSGTSGVIVQSRPTVIDCFPKNIVNLAKRGNGSGTASRWHCEMCLLCWKNRYAYQP